MFKVLFTSRLRVKYSMLYATKHNLNHIKVTKTKSSENQVLLTTSDGNKIVSTQTPLSGHVDRRVRRVFW